MNTKLIELLYRSFDGELTPNENKILSSALNASLELREERERILEIRKTISSVKKPSFQPLFADRVIEKIFALVNKPKRIESIFDTLFTAFRPLAIASILIILIFVSINMFNSKEVSIESAFAVSNAEATVEEAFEPTLALTLE
jgi:hypothetical protein